MAALIELERLTKRFGAFTAVDDLSFAVRRGEVLGFLGPNGAGKSTSMKMVAGFLPITSGRARIAGHDVASAPMETRRRLGYLPEGAPLYPDMTPAQLLAFAADARGLAGAKRRERTAEVIERVSLGSVLHQRVETLSKGFKRRVGLALAILHDPEVLVLDEPTDGLDPNQKHEVRALIRELSGEKAIVLSTHILEEVEAVCTRVVLISAGAKRFEGTPAELARRSPHFGALRLVLPRSQAAALRKLLTGIEGVERVETLASEEFDPLGTAAAAKGTNGEDDPGGRAGFAVLGAGAPRVAAEVLGRAREAGLALEEISVERGRLEDVFRNLTSATRKN